MARTVIFLLLLVSGANVLFAQSELDPYKYVIVPKKFEFLEEDQYSLNSLTKFLFEKQGYNTLLEGEEYPREVKDNPCLAATAHVVNNSNMFTTKLKVVMKNCYNDVVYTSEEGRSKIKEYDKTYGDALRNCFVSIGELDHAFNPELVINRKAQQDLPVAVSLEEKKVTHTEPAVTKQETEHAATMAPVFAVTSSEAPEKAFPVVPADPMPKPEPVVVAAAMGPSETDSEKKSEKKPESNAAARSFSNGELTFLLIPQGEGMLAYVSDSRSDAYQKGQLLGTFKASSLPGVYQVEWVGPVRQTRISTLQAT